MRPKQMGMIRWVSNTTCRIRSRNWEQSLTIVTSHSRNGLSAGYQAGIAQEASVTCSSNENVDDASIQL
jgi:hypothetical protein